jgi:hypothetical protein
MNLQPVKIPVGGWRATAIQDVYRTRDGRACFTFRFVNVGSHYEIDIAEMPSYSSYGRNNDLHHTHRLPSDRGGYKVCIGNENSVTSLDKARKWAGNWSEETWKYLRTGERF